MANENILLLNIYYLYYFHLVVKDYITTNNQAYEKREKVKEKNQTQTSSRMSAK